MMHTLKIRSAGIQENQITLINNGYWVAFAANSNECDQICGCADLLCLTAVARKPDALHII